MDMEKTVRPAQNPLENPKLKPALEVIRKVVFSRDETARHITLDDLRVSLRYLKVARRDAMDFLVRQLGDDLPPEAGHDELAALLAVDNGTQGKLRFEENAGRIFRDALLRFDCFVTIPELSGRLKMKTLYSAFYKAAKGIAGQDAAARQSALHLAMQLADPSRKVPATLLLHGPDGCGTREMTIALSDALAKSGYSLLEVNCAQYRSEGEASAWHGAKSFWSGSKPGAVTSFIHANPQAVVIFHNLDRTLPEVMRSLYDPLTFGIMTDQYGLQENSESRSDKSKNRQATPVDCSKSVFLFSASEGSEWYGNPDLASLLSDDAQSAQATIREALRDAKQTYRGDETAVFDFPVLELVCQHMAILSPQRWAVLRQAAKKGLQQAQRRFEKRFGCKLLLSGSQSLADAHLLSLGAGQGLAAASAESFERGFLAQLGAWLVEQDSVAVAELALDAEAFKKTLGKLGPEPLDALRRKGHELRYSAILEDTPGGTRMILRNFYLQRTRRLSDFTGAVKIEAVVPEIKFSDVAGHEKAKKFFAEMIGYLNQPEKIESLGICLPAGAVLVGPPGTGKTRLAQAFAGEAGLPFLAVAGPDLLNSARMDELYRIARSNAPCVIFIDEVDALGQRGNHGALHDSAINKLLTNIQGFSSRAPIFHLLATNREDMIDEALTRAGRIDRRFYIGVLERAGRETMCERLLEVAQLDRGLRDKLVGQTYGMTGAELEKVLRESGLRRLRSERGTLALDEVLEEISTVKFGPRRDEGRRGEATRHRVALHEVGHAVCHLVTHPEVPLDMITIAPRNQCGEGFVRINHELSSTQRIETPETVKNHIVLLLGGRAAEMIQYGNEGRSGGATADLTAATRAAWQAVAHAGLDHEMPVGSLLGFTEFKQQVPDELAKQAWERAQIWLKEAEEDAARILREHWPLVEYLTVQLLEQDTLDGTEFARLVDKFMSGSAIPAISVSQPLPEE